MQTQITAWSRAFTDKLYAYTVIYIIYTNPNIIHSYLKV